MARAAPTAHVEARQNPLARRVLPMHLLPTEIDIGHFPRSFP
jgi:hypothetical protein